MTKTERAVCRAALRCVGRSGYAFLYDRRDARFITVNQAAFKALENAVNAYRATQRSKGKR